MFAPTLTIGILVVLLCVTVGQLATTGELKDNMTNPLTSHVLDTSRGRPAAGILVKLYKKGVSRDWDYITEQLTNNDGRISNLLTETEFTPSVYRLNFDTKSYFMGKGEKTFYPFIDVIFEIENPEEHYHVPILLNAYGFSTYRGS